jgi:hypothetical protein
VFSARVLEPSRLLPTIRSRSRRLDLRRLQAEPLKRAVSAALAAADRTCLPTGLGAAGAAVQGQRTAGAATRGQRRLELHERIEAV